jgi:hypothetical protein
MSMQRAIKYSLAVGGGVNILIGVVLLVVVQSPAPAFDPHSWVWFISIGVALVALVSPVVQGFFRQPLLRS